MKSSIVTVSPKYQVVIPQQVRDNHGIKPGAKMAVLDFGNVIRLVPVRSPESYIGIAVGADTRIDNDTERF